MEVVKFENKNESLIKYLEELLQQAKEGKLQSFSGCGIYQNGSTVTVNSIDDFVDPFKMIGLLTHLQFCLTAGID